MHLWDLRPGLMVLDGTLWEPGVSYHPAVHLAVGTHGPMMLSPENGADILCRLVVIGSGTRHALRADPESAVLSVFLGLATTQGIALNALSTFHGRPTGFWTPDDEDVLADAVRALWTEHGPAAGADYIVGQLHQTATRLCGAPVSLHPQLRQALAMVSNPTPGPVNLASVANAVSLSPDYLGRLCKRQTAVSFSAVTRWARLMTILQNVLDGAPITQAVTTAGFTDDSHANRACRELAAAPPREIARALQLFATDVRR